MQEFLQFEQDGIHVHVLPKPKNKMIHVQVSIIAPIHREHWTAQALLPHVLLHRLNDLQVEWKQETWCNRHLITLQLLQAHERYLPGHTTGLSGSLQKLAALLLNPWFLQSPTDLETVVAQEKRKQGERIREAREGHHAKQRLLALAAPDHPSAWPMYGFEQEVQVLDSTALLQRYQHLLQVSEIHVFVVGAVQTDEVCAAVRSAFDVAPPLQHLPDLLIAPAKPESLLIQESSPGPAQVSAALHVGSVFSQYPTFWMLYNLYSALPTSRLYDRTRNQQQWVYHIDTYLVEETGYLFLHTRSESHHRSEFITACREELFRLQTDPLSDEDLHTLSTACARQLRFRMDLPWRAIAYQLKIAQIGSAFTLPRMVTEFPNVTATDLLHLAQTFTFDTIFYTGGEDI
ncbi:MAG: M16 family metallopeptidase [Tumebacillaceae bacterium]